MVETLDYKFSCGSAGKESTCSVGDLALIPGLGRPPGEGKGYPLQYSGLEYSMHYIVHGVAKSRTRRSDFHFQTLDCRHQGQLCLLILFLLLLCGDKRTSLVAQMEKNPPSVQERQIWEVPLEKEMATHSSILAWEIPRTEEPGGLQSMDGVLKKPDTIQQLNSKIII